MSSVQKRDPVRTSKPVPFFTEADVDIDTFAAVCGQTAAPSEFPSSKAIEQNVPIYDGYRIREKILDDRGEEELRHEWCRCLNGGPGVFVVQHAYADTRVIDSMSDVFQDIIRKERSNGVAKGDHFGSNERIWNSFQKSFDSDPETAITYYGNSVLALAARSWLGPHYQMSAQVNIVKPGSAAQSPHRDYHLGFQSDQTIAEFPAHAQEMSQYLTLQGGIAHSDMPKESGPTLLLPYSHQYPMGYMAFRQPEFIDFFESNKVQLPLKKGDAIFFNPALFHGAGANSSTQDRIGNLVQISSAFGRTMETINHQKITEAAYPILLARQQIDAIPQQELNDTLSAVAEGYSFPTNLDLDRPLGGNAPQSMHQLVQVALNEKWSAPIFEQALNKLLERRKA